MPPVCQCLCLQGWVFLLRLLLKVKKKKSNIKKSILKILEKLQRKLQYRAACYRPLLEKCWFRDGVPNHRLEASDEPLIIRSQAKFIWLRKKLACMVFYSEKNNRRKTISSICQFYSAAVSTTTSPAESPGFNSNMNRMFDACAP